ncbi:MAG: hypothetical protein WBY84_10635, partial [Pseudolabrys sp.]
KCDHAKESGARLGAGSSQRKRNAPTRLGADIARGRCHSAGAGRAPKAYASWCINRKVDGGLELPPKTVQQRMGHASIAITMDVYGHLFPSGDDGAELAAAEMALLA